MNATQLGIVALLKSAITDKACALPEQFDMAQAYSVLRKHSLGAMGYAGALKCGISKQLPVMQQLRQEYYAALLKSEGQMAAVRELSEAFDAAGIDYMPLKGSILKGMYPAHEYRAMGDADILIRTEQYPQIEPIMMKLGYTAKSESDHELVWQSKALLVELHKRLVPTKNQDYYRYFQEGWNKARLIKNNCYEMRAEDTYIFLFMHFAKHYRGAGVGLRQLLDLWIYRSNCSVDMELVAKELEKMQLRQFHENISRLLDAWFGNGQMDDVTEFVAQVIFANGNWGDAQRGVLSTIVRNRKENEAATIGKWRRFFVRLFPPAKDLAYKYPVLKRWAILLPVFWAVRLFEAAFTKRKRAMKTYRLFAQATQQQIESFEQALEYVGLRFEK